MSITSEKGFGLVEMVVSVGLFLLIFAAVSSEFLTNTRRSYDHSGMTKAAEQARAIQDIIAFDLRMMGSGMPLGQANFLPTSAGYQSAPYAPYPIYIDSSDTKIHFRFNERGSSTILSADYYSIGR